MAPAVPRLRILSVGGNAVSAFLSWRLQATNACDVTLVWKSGFDSVAQYGISFKSALYGNERFKPHSVVRLPEDAANLSKQPYDYVLLCVKALPDVYDIASIIESVVAPQHTCILMNTTHSIGMEKYLEERFPTNVVLSLVSGAEIVQLGGSEFEHKGATDIWVGPANTNSAIPPSIQTDMAEALAMTLSSGQVDCKVSPNIRQQQYERMIGNIAFHTPSVLMDIPSHAEMYEKHGLRDIISGIIDELMTLATAQQCTFPPTFKQDTIAAMLKPQESHSILFQDFLAHRPMEVETYLGAPLAIARQMGVPLPRIEMLYGLMHHTNIINQMKPAPMAAPPSPSNQPTRMGPPGMPRGPMLNGNGPMNGAMKNGVRPPGAGGRTSSLTGPPPMMRRGPPPMNGFPPRQQSNGYNPNAPPPGQRRPSLEANDLEEFSHLMLYENIPDGAIENTNGMYENNMGSSSDLALRERELMLRQRELQIREQEMALRQRGGGPGGPGGPGQRRMPPPPPSHAGGYDDDDDEDDYFDPMGPSQPQQAIDPDNFDMMSVTSRRTRKAPSASQLRKNPEIQGGGGNGGGRQRGFFGRGSKQNRTSARLVSEIPGLHDSLMQNPLMGYSSNRYGSVDRSQMGQESRANSLTASRLDELQGGPGGGYGAYPQRRTSQSPGNPLGPQQRQSGRPSPPNGYPFPNGTQNGMPNGRPSPPGMRQPVPRHPPGHGNAVAPHQVEQHVGVSKLYPPNMGPPKVRSLTGSASASAESGDSSASAHLDSGNSAHSSQSSLGPRHPIGVR